MQLISEKPETEAVVKEKLTGLHKMWEVLESTTQTKAQRLFDANKAELFTQSCADLDKWLHGLESQIQSDDYGKDLTSVNILLKKQQASELAATSLGRGLRHTSVLTSFDYLLCCQPLPSTSQDIIPFKVHLSQPRAMFLEWTERHAVSRRVGHLGVGILFFFLIFLVRECYNRLNIKVISPTFHTKGK